MRKRQQSRHDLLDELLDDLNAFTVTEDASLAGQVPPAIRQAGTIKVATHVPFPPGDFSKARGAPGSPMIGFDPEPDAGRSPMFSASRRRFAGRSAEEILPHVENGQTPLGALIAYRHEGTRETVQMVTYLRPGEAFLTKPGGPRTPTSMNSAVTRSAPSNTLSSWKHVLEAADRLPR